MGICLQELKEKVNWPARRDAVAAFNASSLWRKRGLSLVPCMYPLWCGMRSAMVQVYADGSVRVAHSGVEIGQGLSIKVLQTAAYELSQVSIVLHALCDTRRGAKRSTCTMMGIDSPASTTSAVSPRYAAVIRAIVRAIVR